MEYFGFMGFIFGILGLGAYSKVAKLEKALKEKGILDENYGQWNFPYFSRLIRPNHKHIDPRN